MSQSLTAAELALWPLFHGNLELGRVLDSIRRNGLRAPGPDGRNANSFGYDRALGRTGCVFLYPARTRGGYGFGSVVLVAPSVLSQPGVKCALHDIGDVIRHVGCLAENPEHTLPHWIEEQKVLRELVELHRCRTAERAEIERVPADLKSHWIEHNTETDAVASDDFTAYASRYLLSPAEFFERLVSRYPESNASVEAFLNRPNYFSEEILVPAGVPPKYLLGYLSHGAWHCWTWPASPDLAERLIEVVRLLTGQCPQAP